MEKTYFEESQRFTQIWLWLLIISVLLLMVGIAFAGVYIQLVQKRPFGNKPMSDTGIVIFSFFSILFSIGLIILHKSFHLQTRIDRFGISYRYFPLIRKWHTIYREQINNWKIVSRFTMQFGVRYGINSKTLNVQGNKKIALKLSSGKTLYIGTQQPEEISRAMKKLFDRQPND